MVIKRELICWKPRLTISQINSLESDSHMDHFFSNNLDNITTYQIIKNPRFNPRVLVIDID